MKHYLRAARQPSGRTSMLTICLVLQSFAAVFFVTDVITDLQVTELDLHHMLEAMVSFALVLGVIFGGREVRRTIEQMRRGEEAVAAASGALAELIEAHFRESGLTPAKADVALLALKGFDGGEIADLRGAATGTVRAQLTRVYAKAGVSNRAQLISVFIEELMDGPVEPLEKAG